MDKTVTFIITDREDSGFVESIYAMRNIMDYGNGIVLHEAEYLKNILSHVKNDFEFRVLIHAGLKSNEKTPKGIYFLKELEDEFKVTNFKLITRNDDYFPNDEKIIPYKGYELHNADYINTKEFIDQLSKIKLSDIQVEENKTEPNDSQNKMENQQLQQGNNSSEIQNNTIDSNSGINNKNTIAILAALADDELSPFRKALNTVKRAGYEECKIDKNDLLLYAQNRMGMVDAAIFVSKIIKEKQPDAIIMPGVCGGRKSEKVKLYDLIIPEKVLDIITGQYKNKKFVPYGYNADSNEEFIKHIKGIVSDNDFVHNEMYNLIPNEKYEREKKILQTLDIHFDVMACGPFVLKTDNFLERKAKEMNHKIKGFEMESYGFLRTNELLNKKGLSLIVKSVMDYTDSKKSDTSQFSDVISDNSISEDAQLEVPEGENIKKMAAYFSSICVRALLPHVLEYLNIKSHRD